MTCYDIIIIDNGVKERDYMYINEEEQNSEYNETVQALRELIQRFDTLQDKANFAEISTIHNAMYNLLEEKKEGHALPKDIIDKFEKEIKPLYANLEVAYTNAKQAQWLKEQEERKQQEQHQKEEIELQTARLSEIQSNLPTLKDQINRILRAKKNDDSFKEKRIEILKEYNYFLHRNTNITEEDMVSLTAFRNSLDGLEQEIMNPTKSVQVSEAPQDAEQINLVKKQIFNYSIQIQELLDKMQPYMQSPKVNQELSKVIAKNNELDASTIINSLADYQKVLEVKENIVSYLEKANKVIEDGIQMKKEQEQTSLKETPSSLSSEEFEIPETKENQEVQEGFLDEFDNPKKLTGPDKKFNEDGTYTLEYMSYLAASSPGAENEVYEQLEQYNDEIRFGKRNAQKEENEYPGSGMHPGM